MKKHNFAIIGGDKRISYVAQILSGKGYSVICYGVMDVQSSSNLSIANSLKEAISNSMVIIFGIPFVKDGSLFFSDGFRVNPSFHHKISLQDVQRYLRKNQTLFAGMIPHDFRQTCEARQITCYDFMTDESFIMQNAALTAEGALLEALSHQDTALHQSNALIIGYGRCGMILADKCKGLHAKVSVCDSLPQNLARAASLGFSVLKPVELCDMIVNFEYLFNTAPSKVFTKTLLQNMHQKSLLIDIASDRVGVDYESALDLGRNVLYCPGLPGKYTPQTSAKYISDHILSMIS